ncbi:MAG: hypothetical protein LBK74_00305 [Treponema sp.]|jgi:hypothetical protein|nr:hypothetical protein [Treponema sp.]
MRGPDLFRRRVFFGRICRTALLLAGTGLFAQTGSAGSGSSGSVLPVPWDFSPSFNVFKPVPLAGPETDPPDETITAGKPQWVKDLRRAEIVAFGSFPFTLFFTKTFIDLYRTATHDWDRRYAPWPFKAAGAVSMDGDQIKMMFAIAVSASLTISITDYIIVRYKRSRAEE